MQGKVADGSVLGAVAFGEPRSVDAAALLSDDTLYAPLLSAYKLANIARKKILREPGLRTSIILSLTRRLATDINWSDVDHLEVLGLGLESGLTTYDASYLLLHAPWTLAWSHLTLNSAPQGNDS